MTRNAVQFNTRLVANAHFGASLRNFAMSENHIPQGQWMTGGSSREGTDV